MNNILDHTNEKELDRFEARYFERMNEAEATAFDGELQEDPEMALRYRAFRLAISGIRSTRKPEGIPDRNELRARLVAVDAELDRNESKNHNWLPYAAAAAVVIGAVALWLFRPPSNEALANEFQLVEPGLPVLMDTGSHRMDEIMNALKLEHFNSAEKAVDEALLNSPHNDTLRYYKGVIVERTHGCDEAMQHYTMVPMRSVFSDRARYRRAICLIRTGKEMDARKELQDLNDAEHPQVRERSIELLRRL